MSPIVRRPLRSGAEAVPFLHPAFRYPGRRAERQAAAVSGRLCQCRTTTAESMIRPALALLVLLGTAGAAMAQSAPSTLLHLSATASEQVTPDRLVAELLAQATAASPAEAQRRVNALMAEGMKTAQAAAGVQARATGYSAGPADDKRSGWTAQQTLHVEGAQDAPLLDLVGALQQKGFVVAVLDWQVSPSLYRRTHEQAETEALKTLQARAASAAATLGLRVDHLQDVRLDGPMFQPRGMVMAAKAAPAPQATQAPEEVTAQVSADVVLLR